MLPKLTKHTAGIVLRDRRKPTPSHADGEARALTHSTDEVSYIDNLNLYRDYFEKMRDLRARARRCFNYVNGHQWEDFIEDPDSERRGAMIREKDYIRRQGVVPLKYNIMKKTLKSVVGLFESSKPEPVAVSRERDEQKLGEMMTAVMQYAYDVNGTNLLNSNALQYAYSSSFFIRSIYFRYNDERKMSDVYVQNENLDNIFFNPDVQDPLFRDLTVIGAIRDMSLQNLIEVFARSPKDVKKLTEEYSGIAREGFEARDTLSRDRHTIDVDFFTPIDPNKCRVYEVWTKESEECYYCHDRAMGEEYTIACSDLKSVINENNRRKAEMVELGYSADDASLIDYEWMVRRYWYVRYLTPHGTCILEGESPYEHGSHPFVISAYPMVNGETSSPAEDQIDVQRVLNRTFSQIDFLRQNGAKNTLMVPYTAIPDGMTPEQFAVNYSRNGRILFYKPDPSGKNIPEPIKTNSVSAGDIEMIKLYMQLGDEISGVSSALRGEKAASGTPSSLYAQQVQNSANNLSGFLSWFNNCVRSSDYKMMQVIQQYYDDKRYIPITGGYFSEEAKWYDPEKIRNSMFDLKMIDGVQTPLLRLAMEENLKEMLKDSQIDMLTYLQLSSMPYADKLSDIIQRNKDNAERTQQELQQAINNQPQQ